MAYLWTVTVGYVFLLGMVGGIFVYFLRSSLNLDDSTKIDPLKKS
ncbi:hypothetical protein [Jeotgalibacillus marinus]|uniref:Uncharacterized protein n=1 Tax=Jeotgalibacillus marinus TaxID=86667 RepID=A0ABV3Q0X9_9BACL